MQYRRLGKHGLELSALSLGTWEILGNVIDKKKSEVIFGTAYDLGINYFDTAETYSKGQSEIDLGNIIKNLSWPRETFVLSGKVFWGTYDKRPNTWGLSRKHIIEGCHASLKRLQLEHLDIFLCHRPDIYTPIEETVLAMNTLINQGKVLYWGTSEWSAEQFLEAYEFSVKNNLFSPVVEQLQYNIFHRRKVEKEFFEILNEIGIGLTIWSPLKSGLLAGKYTHGIPESSRLGKKENEWLLPEVFGDNLKKRLEKIISLDFLATRELGISLQQLSLAWCLYNKFITSVITGASCVEHLVKATSVFGILNKIDSDVINKIDNILTEE